MHANATTLAPVWSSDTTANATSDTVDLDFIVGLIIPPSIFAGIGIFTWTLSAIINTYYHQVDPVKAIFRFTPNQVRALRGGNKKKDNEHENGKKTGLSNLRKVVPTAVISVNTHQQETKEESAEVEETTTMQASSKTQQAPLKDVNSDDSDDVAPNFNVNGVIAGNNETRTLLENLEKFARAAEQRIADGNPTKFRNSKGELKNKHILKRLVLEQLTKRGTTFQFLNTVRRRDDFFNFDARSVHNATILTRQSFDAGRRILYLTFSGTSFSRCLVEAIVFLCYSGVVSSGIYICKQIDIQYQMDTLSAFLEHCRAINIITDSITQYVIFMAVTYAMQALSQWINIMTTMYKIHSDITSLGLNWSKLLPFNDSISMESKYKVYRWLNVYHVYIYRRVAAGGEHIKHNTATDRALVEHLVDVGLLTQKEKEQIAQVDDELAGQLMILKWLSDLFSASQLTGIGAPGVISMLEHLSNLRLHADVMITELQQPPISWAQLMQLLIDVYLLLTPLGFLHNMYIEEFELQVFPILSTFLLAIFFLGILGLVDIVKEPFGNDVDDFSPDTLLFSAERQLFTVLASPGLSYLNDLQDGVTEFKTNITPATRTANVVLGVIEKSGNAYRRKLTNEEHKYLTNRKEIAGDDFGAEDNPYAPEIQNKD